LTYSNTNIKNFRFYLIILCLILFILAFTPVSSAANTTNSSNSSTYTISYVDTSLGGNVLNNPEISQNIPKTYLSNQIFNMTKKGSVVLKFGKGNGPKLLITAGIHGNEEEANIAAMKYLEYIKNKSFNGTLYIIPFAIPADTALNSRNYKGQDPNRIANKKATPGYNIIQFARNNGVQYLLDVHSGSQVGSKGYIFVSNPSTITVKEKNWSNHIKSKTGCYISTNGADDAGMVRNCAKKYSINTITLEVERDSIPTMTSANVEYKMIQAAVNYLGFPADSYGPKITSTNPAKDALGVPLTSAVTITFSKNIKSSANFSGIYIKNLTTGKKVSLASKTISGNTLTLKMASSRIKNNVYQVYIPAGAVKDGSGDNLVLTYSYSFSTTPDTVSPKVSSTKPANKTTGIPLTSAVTITFNKNIKSSANFSGIYIKNLTTGKKVTLASKTISGKTLTVKMPYSRLRNNVYQVYIPASAVKDATGNNLKASYSFQFQTVK